MTEHKAVESQPRITYVEAGDNWNDGTRDWDILKPCTDNTPGHWFCTTHDLHLTNNMHRDGHCADIEGSHRLGWFCHEHGMEAP